jgi:hypothetical protein
MGKAYKGCRAIEEEEERKYHKKIIWGYPKHLWP